MMGKSIKRNSTFCRLIVINKKGTSKRTYFSTPPPSATVRITFVNPSYHLLISSYDRNQIFDMKNLSPSHEEFGRSALLSDE